VDCLAQTGRKTPDLSTPQLDRLNLPSHTGTEPDKTERTVTASPILAMP